MRCQNLSLYLTYLKQKKKIKNATKGFSSIIDQTQDLFSGTPGTLRRIENSIGASFCTIQLILAGMLAGVQGDIRCKVLAALSTVK